MFLSRLTALLALLFALSLPSKVSAQIYADVTVGGAVSGTFTITLEHVKTPAAVANFIGLATGKKGWLDLNTGAIRYDGFYNGVTFHRVVVNFVSQTGSRNGLGTDGPGYTFRDEIDATLTHVNYAVAMANSGKNTNGSQFYICKGAQHSLDGGYTIFGLVTAGQAVCDAINATPVSGSTPVVPIVIQSVNVYGPSFASFILNQPLLPKLFNARPIFKRVGAVSSLDYDHLTFSEYTTYDSASLATWTKSASNYFSATAPAGDNNVSASAVGNQHFYRMVRADYSTCYLPDLVGNTFHFSNPLGGTAALNATRTAGTWTFDSGGTFTIVSAAYTLQPYTPRLFLQLNNGYQFLLNLQAGGTYTGQTNVSGFSNVSGNYTIAP